MRGEAALISKRICGGVRVKMNVEEEGYQILGVEEVGRMPFLFYKCCTLRQAPLRCTIQGDRTNYLRSFSGPSQESMVDGV